MNKRILLSLGLSVILFSSLQAQDFCYDIDCYNAKVAKESKEADNTKIKTLESKLEKIEAMMANQKTVVVNTPAAQVTNQVTKVVDNRQELVDIKNEIKKINVDKPSEKVLTEITVLQNKKPFVINNPVLDTYKGKEVVLLKYTLKKGETYTKVIKDFRVNWERTNHYNGWKTKEESYTIKPGETMIIPILLEEHIKKAVYSTVPAKKEVVVKEVQKDVEKEVIVKEVQKDSGVIVVKNDTYQSAAKEVIKMNTASKDSLLNDKITLSKEVNDLKKLVEGLQSDIEKRKLSYQNLEDKYAKTANNYANLANKEYDNSKQNQSCDNSRNEIQDVIVKTAKFKDDMYSYGKEKAIEMNHNFVNTYLK